MVRTRREVLRELSLSRYPEIEWRRIMGIRDFLSHHYSDTNEEVIFNVCQKYVPQLIATVDRISRDLSL